MKKVKGKNIRFIVKTTYGFIEDTHPVFQTGPDAREKIYREWIEESVRSGNYIIIDDEIEDQEWEEE